MSPICYLAEPNGEVVNGKHGWYHSSQTDKWYWFNGADSLILNSLVKDAGKKYYVGYDGAMQTGVFWIPTYDEDKKEYVSKQIYADESGIINEQQGWKKDSAGNWYYVKKDGSAAINEIVEIGSEKYYLDYNGQMETGKINIYDSGVKVIPLFVDHLPLVSRIASICILIPQASAILLPLARCQCLYGDLLTGITSRYPFR